MHVNIYQHAALVKWRCIKVLAGHYSPPQPICVPSTQFEAKNPTHALELMRSHPLAQRISNDDEGLLFVTPLALHVLHKSGETVPLGRCAKPNPHWMHLAAAMQWGQCWCGTQRLTNTMQWQRQLLAVTRCLTTTHAW